MIKDKTGVPMTCPLIDEAIGLINSGNIDAEIITDLLEQVRTANIQLREFGNEQFKLNNNDTDN